MNVYEKTLFSILILNKCPFPDLIYFTGVACPAMLISRDIGHSCMEWCFVKHKIWGDNTDALSVALFIVFVLLEV